MGKIIRDYVVQNNYYMLYIIDGLDNINFFFKDRKFFLRMLIKHLYDFPLKLHGTSKNELLILSIRDTTYELLRKALTEGGDYLDSTKLKNVNSFFKIYIDTNNINKIVLNRRLKHFFKSYSKYNDCFLNEVLQTISDYHHKIDETRWNSNLRCFLFNHLNLAKLITFRYFYYWTNNQPNFDIKQNIDIFENVNFFLNGELFVDEQEEHKTGNEGSNLFNLFGYVNYAEKPFYFIYSRILQLVRLQPQISKEQLFAKLYLIGYLDVDIEFCIDRLISSGMLVTIYTPYGHVVLKFRISLKGEFVLNSFFNDIHFLYYSSLNTKLPMTLIKKMKISPNNFVFDKTINKRYYPPYSIITGYLFLSYLKIVNSTELLVLPAAMRQSFELPILNNALYSSINTMVEASLKDEDYKRTLNNWLNTN